MKLFNILYIKTPKTASELVRRYLSQYVTEANLEKSLASNLDFLKQDKMEVSLEHVKMSKNILKHFIEKKNQTLDTLYFTSLREPLERLVSHYYYSNLFNYKLDFNEWYYDFCKGKLNYSNHGWVKPENSEKIDPIYYDLNNYMSNYIDVKKPKQLFEKYDFVFVPEKIERIFDILEVIFEYKFERYLGEKKINHNLNYKDNFKVTDEIKNLFYERNEKDLELYNIAKNKYHYL